MLRVLTSDLDLKLADLCCGLRSPWCWLNKGNCASQREDPDSEDRDHDPPHGAASVSYIGSQEEPPFVVEKIKK